MITETVLSLKAMALTGAPKEKEQVAGAPSGGIRIVGVIAVVGDDVAVDFAQAFCDGRVGHFGENLFNGADALAAAGIGKAADWRDRDRLGRRESNRRPRGRRGPSAACDSSVVWKLVIGAERGERKRGGDDLGVRRRREEMIGVQLVKVLARVAVRDFNTPISLLAYRLGSAPRLRAREIGPRRRAPLRLERDLLLRGLGAPAGEEIEIAPRYAQRTGEREAHSATVGAHATGFAGSTA